MGFGRGVLVRSGRLLGQLDPDVYLTIDREHPTSDHRSWSADDMFVPKDLHDWRVVNAEIEVGGYERSSAATALARSILSENSRHPGKTKLPRTIASRSIILKMWPKKPDEKAEDFAYADDPEF